MNPTIASYLAALVSLVVVDGAWLASTYRAFYSPRIGHLMAAAPSWLPIAIFYVGYAAAIVFFAALPAIRGNASLLTVFLTGAALGAVAYGTYDLTNQATMRSWPVLVTVVDIAWGALVTGLAALVAVWVARLVR